MMTLSERWRNLWQALRAPEIPEKTLADLITAYSSPGRFYHNLKHVEDCLRIFDLCKDFAAHPEAVELAIWFHDAVYDSRSGDNEQKSADWARLVIKRAGLDEALAEKVWRLILATRHNEEAVDEDARVLVDVDLSILGREGEVFWEYEHNIRREYAWVPDFLFKRKRAEILRNFLEREHIYQLELCRRKFESTARQNIGEALAKLEGATI
ncbi:MAG TPA: hypothetical protein VM870_03645 [Pyrinomonadaceae bacterium]|jgi:predicted metal-dependent HD superfamily phosphohydrolase|nr:hypothetical protein [Pyrinomonadaceae bacterium]